MLSSYGNAKRINTLIARKKYPGAIKLLRKELDANPENKLIRQQMAELLPSVGQHNEAKQILGLLADEYTDTGFLTKAIALLKKIQRIDPSDPSVSKRLTSLVSRRESTTSIISTSDAISQPTPQISPVASAPEDGIEVAHMDEEFEFAVSETKAPPSAKDTTPEMDAFINSPLFESISED